MQRWRKYVPIFIWFLRENFLTMKTKENIKEHIYIFRHISNSVLQRKNKWKTKRKTNDGEKEAVCHI